MNTITNTTNNNIQNTSYETVRRVMHDIQSPLASLKMMELISTNLSAEDKELLSSSTGRITRILDSLSGFLNNPSSVQEVIEPINIHSTIEKILIQKKTEYHNRKVDFLYNAQTGSESLSIKGVVGNFERMLSNIINNSVDAFASKAGTVTIALESDESQIHLTISDNGKGMPPEVLEKLRNSIAITHGKANGHGVGCMQIRDTIKQLSGEITIDSTVGVGTTICLTWNRY